MTLWQSKFEQFDIHWKQEEEVVLTLLKSIGLQKSKIILKHIKGSDPATYDYDDQVPDDRELENECRDYR